MKIKTIETDRFKIEIHTRFNENMRDRMKKTRVYVADDVSDAFGGETLKALQAAEENLGDRRFSERGLFPDVDRLYDVLNREIGRAKKAATLAALAAAKIDDHGTPIKARFDKHAGCSCPCSPGVVLDRALYMNVTNVYGGTVDIYVTPLTK